MLCAQSVSRAIAISYPGFDEWYSNNSTIGVGFDRLFVALYHTEKWSISSWELFSFQ